MVKRHDIEAIGRIADELAAARIAVDDLGDALPEDVDASLLGTPIADHVESAVTNLAALVTALGDLEEKVRRAAERYDDDGQANMADVGQLGLDLADTLESLEQGGEGDARNRSDR